MPAVSAVTKVQGQTLLYDIILNCSFNSNEAIWDRKTSDRKALELIKRGDLDIASGKDIPGAFYTFFIGVLLSAFAVFPSIANILMRCEADSDDAVSVVLENGRRLKIPKGSWSKELQELIIYYKQKILGWDKAPALFEKKDWQSLRDIFRYSQLRLSGEEMFLKSLLGPTKKILAFLKEPRVRMDSLFIIVSVLPLDQLNMFFLELAPSIPEYMTGTTASGLTIDIRHYFSQTAVDMENLFSKIKILLMLYSRHELVIDYVVEDAAKTLLQKYLQNDAVRAKTLEAIEKTLYGQYQPRLDLAKAFIKILT